MGATGAVGVLTVTIVEFGGVFTVMELNTLVVTAMEIAPGSLALQQVP